MATNCFRRRLESSSCFLLTAGIKGTIKRPFRHQKMDESHLKNRESSHFEANPNKVASNQESPLYRLAKFANRFYFEGYKSKECKPVYCQNKQIGLVRQPVEDAIAGHTEVFRIDEDRVTVLLDDYKSTSRKINDSLKAIKESHDFEALRAWRDEEYEVRTGGLSSTSLFRMERAATCMFGFKQYGVDITGYVNHPEKGLCVWLQRRSYDKPTWPGKWDSMVSGGLTVGHNVKEAAIKEALEEANVPNEMAEQIKPRGCVTFFFESERGIFPETEYVFDLELPMNFQPSNNDGEVEEFALIQASELASRICEKDMKTTSCPVIMDFLVRHGVINVENEPNFVEVTELLHMPIHTF